MYKQNSNTKNISNFIEFLLLFLVAISICAQFKLGSSNSITQLLQVIFIPGMVFLAGYDTCLYADCPHILRKKALNYAIIYVLFGLYIRVILYQDEFFKIFIKIITLTKITTMTEVFFTFSVLFLCASFLAKYIYNKHISKLAFIIISLITFSVVFIPDTVFGYPIIGVFLGCNTYKCIPLIPYTFFYLAGICLYKHPVTFKTHYLENVADHYCSFVFKLKKNISNCFQNLYKLFQERSKKASFLYFILYTLCFLIMIYFVFTPFRENEISIVWMKDAIAQYVPKAHYFMDYMHNALSQILKGDFNIPMYDFRLGLGNAVSFSFEPIYWLLALFDSSDVEFAYTFITIFRLYMAGISVSIFLLYFKKNYYETLFGSLMYTFCGFAIYTLGHHGHFLSPLILIPLLIISTEEVFQKKRWYLCTIFTALSLLSSYYFLYMSTIAMGIYYVARFIFTKNKSIKNLKYFFTCTCTFAFSYLLGVMIGNFTLFTSFTSYMGSGRKGTSNFTALTPFYYKKTWLLNCLTEFISTPSSPGYWLKLGFIPLAYIAVIVLFIKQKKKILKFFFVLCSLFCIFPVAGYIFSGFSSVINRWCYIFALLVTYITVDSLSQLKNLSSRELKQIFIGMMPFALVTLIHTKYRSLPGLIALAMLLCNFIVILFMNKNIRFITKKQAQTLLLLLCCSSICFNSYFQYSLGIDSLPADYAKQGKVLEEINDTPLKVFDNYSDDSFYRVSTSNIRKKTISSSQVMDYNSLSIFSSTIDGPIIDYNAEMGNTAGNMVQLTSFNNRTALNALACVKYYSNTENHKKHLPYGYKKINTKTANGQIYYIYENQYALPLGYTYAQTLTEDQLSKYDTIQKQEIMLQAGIVENTNKTLQGNPAKLSTTTIDIPITDYEMDGISIKGNTVQVNKPDATLTLRFKGIPNTETYLCFTGSYNDGKHSTPRKNTTHIAYGDYETSYSFLSDSHSHATGQNTYLFNLGYRIETVNECTITFESTGDFTFDSLKVYGQPMENYASYMKALSEDTLENIDISPNKITGNISLDEKKLLVLSMPYQKGWTAYVDGKEVPIQKANLMYMGLMLDVGDHDIELHYERPGLKPALIISFTGMVIFIVALIIRRKHNKMKKEQLK